MTALTHTLPTIAPRQPAQRYRRTGDLMMIVAAMVTVLAGLIAYPYASQFSLATQIAAHLVIPVGAGVFKLGYVVRLAAQEAQRPGATEAAPSRSVALRGARSARDSAQQRVEHHHDHEAPDQSGRRQRLAAAAE